MMKKKYKVIMSYEFNKGGKGTYFLTLEFPWYYIFKSRYTITEILLNSARKQLETDYPNKKYMIISFFY